MLLLYHTQVDQLARLPHAVVGSVRSNFNIAEPLEDDLLKTTMWEYLGLTRVYTKRKGSPPDTEDPVVLSEIRKGTTVKSLCANISSELLREFNYALVWGTSAKHSPQRCGLSHRLDDEDVVQIVSKVRTSCYLFVGFLAQCSDVLIVMCSMVVLVSFVAQ